MAIFTPYTLIRTISLFHITAAYFFLTAPRVLADQNVVYILGESMRIVRIYILLSMPFLYTHLTVSRIMLRPWTSRVKPLPSSL